MRLADVIRHHRTTDGPSIVLLVLDGVGDLPAASTGYRTPLEAAKTPVLDELTPRSSLGRLTPVAPGITPGSGPGHLGLFGYDPLEVIVGRGVIEALGLGVDLSPKDVAARANFATLDAEGRVTDRRAGRISDDVGRRLCAEHLQGIDVGDGVTVTVTPGKGHRFVVVFRGEGLGGTLTDSDPGREGEPIHEITPLEGGDRALRTAEVVNRFWRTAVERLRGEDPANGILLRGIGGLPEIDAFEDRFGLRGCAIASYPMYRGLAQLVGMVKIPTEDGPAKEFATYRSVMDTYDFAFIHLKATDMHGEDGNFDAKAAAIEAVDAALPDLLATKPGVLAITGDHSTPVSYKGHGWQPVPVLVHAERAGGDGLPRFTERHAVSGLLGSLRSHELMTVLLAAAGRLAKYGA
jgi:2,3-bisphosphoglycerate-independent phosphoglycerate mutase